MSPVLMFVLKALLASGALAAAGAFLARHLPAWHPKTGHETLDSVLSLLSDACETIVVAELQGDLLSALVKALVDGKPLAGPLLSELPRLKELVLKSLGPAFQASLEKLLGPENAGTRINAELVAAAHTHVASHVETLASGRKLVIPAA